MFQHSLFTDAEIAADPRLATLLDDKRYLLGLLERFTDLSPEDAEVAITLELARFRAVERRREAVHLATMQAENVRRGWRQATFREILGEPLYEDTTRDEG